MAVEFRSHQCEPAFASLIARSRATELWRWGGRTAPGGTTSSGDHKVGVMVGVSRQARLASRIAMRFCSLASDRMPFVAKHLLNFTSTFLQVQVTKDAELGYSREYAAN